MSEHFRETETFRQAPARWDACLFFVKSRCLMGRRWISDLRRPVTRWGRGAEWAEAPLRVRVEAPLWDRTDPAEFPLTAGKVENLRRACLALDGIEIPAGGVLSFWRQLGRASRRAGYVTGRELRSGCLVPTRGGGLCALSGALHQAALEAGAEVLERHAHTRRLPGTEADPRRDATVFWNYVDLRFRAPAALRLEVQLDAERLIVEIRSYEELSSRVAEALAGGCERLRAEAGGNCLSCGMVSCFRHPGAIAAHPPGGGGSGFLLDRASPEWRAWCAAQSRPGDFWRVPLDGARWGKANYDWSPPAGVRVRAATLATLWRSWSQRRLPAQGARRQRTLLEGEARLARSLAAGLDPRCRHLVLSQNLLPHLWRLGVLGGRTYDVLMERLPLAALHERLDEAARKHPGSATLGDFRADPELVKAETAALAAAARWVTPHRGIARLAGGRAMLVDWAIPAASPRGALAAGPARWLLPASPLARKGVFELAEALAGRAGEELQVLGGAREAEDPLAAAGVAWRKVGREALREATALVLPAWVEHQPRLALEALAAGVPVIATRACGLAPHPMLIELERPCPRELRAAMERVLRPAAAAEVA